MFYLICVLVLVARACALTVNGIFTALRPCNVGNMKENHYDRQIAGDFFVRYDGKCKTTGKIQVWHIPNVCFLFVFLFVCVLVGLCL